MRIKCLYLFAMKKKEKKLRLIDDTSHQLHIWTCVIWGTTNLVESAITLGKCKAEVEHWKHGCSTSQHALDHSVNSPVNLSGPIQTWTTHAAGRWGEGPTRLNLSGSVWILNLILGTTSTCCRVALLQSHNKVNMGGPLRCGLVTAEWAWINIQDSLWNFRGNSCGVKEANKLHSKYHWFSLWRKSEQLPVEPQLK